MQVLSVQMVNPRLALSGFTTFVSKLWCSRLPSKDRLGWILCHCGPPHGGRLLMSLLCLASLILSSNMSLVRSGKIFWMASMWIVGSDALRGLSTSRVRSNRILPVDRSDRNFCSLSSPAMSLRPSMIWLILASRLSHGVWFAWGCIECPWGCLAFCLKGGLLLLEFLGPG